MERAELWDASGTREHVKVLENELRARPNDDALKAHIRQLKKVWGFVRFSKAA